jgi:hypothetical protein
MTGNEAKDWKEAISEELDSMKENDVREIAPLSAYYLYIYYV